MKMGHEAALSLLVGKLALVPSTPCFRSAVFSLTPPGRSGSTLSGVLGNALLGWPPPSRKLTPISLPPYSGNSGQRQAHNTLIMRATSGPIQITK